MISIISSITIITVVINAIISITIITVLISAGPLLAFPGIPRDAKTE